MGNRRHYYRNSARLPIDAQMNANMNGLQQAPQVRPPLPNELMNNMPPVGSNPTQRANRFDLLNENNDLMAPNGFMNSGNFHFHPHNQQQEQQLPPPHNQLESYHASHMSMFTSNILRMVI
jgi:hypothetical protein